MISRQQKFSFCPSNKLRCKIKHFHKSDMYDWSFHQIRMTHFHANSLKIPAKKATFWKYLELVLNFIIDAYFGDMHFGLGLIGTKHCVFTF